MQPFQRLAYLVKVPTILSICLLCLIQSASAQDNSFIFRYELVKTSAPPQKRILDISSWTKFTDQDENQTLEDLGGNGLIGKQQLVHTGSKNPLPYSDPRAGMKQVQYVDLGFKLDIILKKEKNGNVMFGARGERAAPAPHPQLEDRTSTVLFESNVLLKRGQVAIIGTFQGPMALKHLKSQFPKANFTENDILVLAVTIK